MARDDQIASGVHLLVAGDFDRGPIEAALARSEMRAQFATGVDVLKNAIAGGRADAVLLPLDLDLTDALDLLAEITADHPDLPVVLLADPGSIPLGEATELGAATVVERPIDSGILRAIRAVLHLSYGSEDADGRLATDTELLGESRTMKRVRQLIDKAAPGTTTILIRGETGTGKELVARAIHSASERSGGPLVVLHCAALPDSLLEDELFGHEKGAFTGADSQRAGRVEQAHGGTLFLDEIGDVTLPIQVKLLRVLQERQLTRLGGSRTIDVDVRFIAATHRDLDHMTKHGEFREDLFYRLNVVPLWVPPLRARRDDLVLLADHFCKQFGRANGRADVRLDEEALSAIRSERWPGNVRQLQNFIERLVVLADSSTLTGEDVARELRERSPFDTEVSAKSGASLSVARRPISESEVVPLDEAVKKAERIALKVALKAAKGNRSKAARLLGVSRATLYNKLKEYQLPD